MNRKKRGRKKRNPGWFKKGKDPRRSTYRFTKEDCRRGYQAALDATAHDVHKYAWLYRRIRGYHRAIKRGSHGEETNGRHFGPAGDEPPW